MNDVNFIYADIEKRGMTYLGHTTVSIPVYQFTITYKVYKKDSLRILDRAILKIVDACSEVNIPYIAKLLGQSKRLVELRVEEMICENYISVTEETSYEVTSRGRMELLNSEVKMLEFEETASLYTWGDMSAFMRPSFCVNVENVRREALYNSKSHNPLTQSEYNDLENELSNIPNWTAEELADHLFPPTIHDVRLVKKETDTIPCFLNNVKIAAVRDASNEDIYDLYSWNDHVYGTDRKVQLIPLAPSDIQKRYGVKKELAHKINVSVEENINKIFISFEMLRSCLDKAMRCQLLSDMRKGVFPVEFNGNGYLVMLIPKDKELQELLEIYTQVNQCKEEHGHIYMNTYSYSWLTDENIQKLREALLLLGRNTELEDMEIGLWFDKKIVEEIYYAK